MTEFKDKFDHACEAFARRLVEAVVETKDDLPFDDNRTLLDVITDSIDGVDLNELVKTQVAAILNVKRV